MVKLGEAGGKLAASRTRACYHDNGVFRFNVGVFPVTFPADDCADISGVSLGGGVQIDFYAPVLQFVFEVDDRRLVVKAGYHDRPDIKAVFPQAVYQFEGIHVVSDAEISADAPPCDISGVYAQKNVNLVLQLLEEFYLYVVVVSGEHP